MTGSIVTLFVEWKVYVRACERLIERVIKIMFSSYLIESCS